MIRICSFFVLVSYVLITSISYVSADKLVLFNGATYTSTNGLFSFEVTNTGASGYPKYVSALLVEKTSDNQTRSVWASPSFEFNSMWTNAIVADNGAIAVFNFSYTEKLSDCNPAKRNL